MIRILLSILTLFLASAKSALPASTITTIARFSQNNLNNWHTKLFQGQTNYQIVGLDGKKVLRAVSDKSASGLYQEKRVDLRQTPYLNWSWRVEKPLPQLDEKTKSGDDYAARIYIIIDGGVFFWKTQALNYVWSSSMPKNSTWPNAFAGRNAMMVAIRDGKDNIGHWYSEKRDVRDDLKRIVGTEFDFIDAVAIMTDTDNSSGSARAYYGDIFFSAD